MEVIYTLQLFSPIVPTDFPSLSNGTSPFVWMLEVGKTQSVGIHVLPCVFFKASNALTRSHEKMGAQLLSCRLIDSRPRGRGFEPNRRHCVVSLSKTH